MSQPEVERFVADLKANETLREELSRNASGIGSVVQFAKDKGYDISADEVRAYIEFQVERELTDAELEAISGGASGGQNPIIVDYNPHVPPHVGGAATNAATVNGGHIPNSMNQATSTVVIFGN